MGKRKLMAAILLAFLCTAFVTQPAFARWSLLNEATQSFTINSSGKTSVYGMTRGQTGVQSVYVKLDLQQQVNGQWTSIKTWSASKDGRLVTLSNERYVQKGYSYRLVTTHTAYKNGDSETTTITSNVKKYP